MKLLSPRTCPAALSPLVIMAIVVLSTFATFSEAQEPISLFDGQNLGSWLADKEKKISIEAGSLLLEGSSGWVLTEKSYRDFVLTFDAQIKKRSAAGVVVRALTSRQGKRFGYEFSMTKNRDGVGALRRWAENDEVLLRKGERDIEVDEDAWEPYRVECTDDRVLAWVGDRRVLGVKGIPFSAGQIGFRVQKGAIRIRNIQISVIGPPTGSSVARAVEFAREGLERPRVKLEVRPQYTREAMQKRVEGSVQMTAVIEADGTVRHVWIEQPLGAGLDEEAVRAARAWEFFPGKLEDIPVPVIVTIDLAFTLK